MAKKIKQFRYYAENDTNTNPNYTRNFPSSISYRNLVSGSIFATSTPIVQLGIQALPGTRFYLNGNNNPIIIGNTGIYELDLQGQGEITALSFEATSIQAIRDNEYAYLIVDIIYEEGVVK